jgi:hypothetical protein
MLFTTGRASPRSTTVAAAKYTARDNAVTAMPALHSVGDRLLNVASTMLRTPPNPSLESQKVLAKG